MRRLFWFHLIGSIVSTAIIASGVLTAYHAGWFQRIDNFLYDVQVKLSADGTTSERISLVLMDAESAGRLERHRGGWSRRHMARALNHLCGAGARVVGMDLVLAAPDTDPQADRLLASAIETCGNVVLARVSASQGRPIMPLEAFLENAAGDGFIDLPTDEDDIIRRVRFFNAVPVDGGDLELVPSFSLELARVFTGIDFEPDFSDPDYLYLGADTDKRLRLPYPELLIRFTGDYHAFDHLSFADVVEGRFSPSRVRGKLVVIGSHLAIEKDYFSTPFSRFSRIAPELADKFENIQKGVLGDKDVGVSCQAFAAETILSGRFINRMSTRGVMLLAMAAVLAGGLFYLPAVNLVASVGILFGGAAASLVGGYLALVGSGLWVDTAPVMTVLFLQFIWGIGLQKTIHRQRSRWVTQLFGRYVSPDVARELVRGDMSDLLDGQHRDVTMLFADIRGFTTLTEQLSPGDIRQLLNRYFDCMIPLVFANGGTLDKLMGDAVMALFGAPLTLNGHPDCAADCALQMVDALKTLRTGGTPGTEQLHVGIGINSGQVTVGNLGTDTFMDYTAIGDAVNLASRLEGLNKQYGTGIILGDATAIRLDDRFTTRRLDRVKVAGRDEPVDILELVDYRSECSEKDMDRIERYESALDAYQAGNLEPARDILEELAREQPDDIPTRLLLDRVETYRALPDDTSCEPITEFHIK